ncbi:tetratricopeptide repeat protein [Leadbettera azotonutricia]|uniref:Tetratricopeptide repeat domain protein n=1 Tax=Leadbettera azotonutricia (strain ATCC BAA-888 / DSM 13862 / ZAS-9) TaxID=545695 RepID=F5YG78_LEAAZ|nr:tetratricopeptide repeat protein [Leadbettera azotonutricia]AEF83502.1 tetratricopeptide repeat domain protein [Leadbettera azotonutricia ZAS-9]
MIIAGKLNAVKRTAVLLVLLLLVAGTVSAQNTNPSWWYERGSASMNAEDWYAAAESFIECIRLNPAHAEGNAALAECYYELGEFDEALLWVRKARSLARGSMALANLEASVQIALGNLEEASKVINDILSREPYNKEALFTAAELDIARGRAGDAVIRFREAVRRFPDDRRLLVSLALVLGSLGDEDAARSYIERALVQHPDDYRVYYYASYLAARRNNIAQALAYAEQSLFYRPGYAPAGSLLASLRYRAGQYEEAARLADELIARKRENAHAWYLKGMAYVRLGRNAEAISVLSTAAAVAPEDEFIRSSLEELLITGTKVEDPQRSRWASWHFARARDYRSRNLLEQALFEYRRGLRLNPYARDRREYADLLRLQGFPARYLEELKFMQNLGLADKTLNDAVESYTALLGNALFRRWEVDPVAISKPHWKVAVFSVANQSAFFHADAGAAGSAYIKDLLVHERNLGSMDLDLRQSSFSQAFRTARENNADYFLVVSVAENERDISITGELFVARTGAAAAVFSTYRTGRDRLRDASRGIVEQLSKALPFRAELIRRRQGQGLIDKGRADGVKDGDAFDVVRQGSAGILSQGIGLVYAPDDVIGKFIVEKADEEVSAGLLERTGFFDRIVQGDEIFIIPKKEEGAAAPSPSVADPELRGLLRTLR